MSFTDLGLQESLAANIEAAGYESPTELQEQLIPLMVQRKSTLVWTQSAAGKTGAFLIPAIDYILNHPMEEHQGARILILTSRRDRVNQITYTVKRLLGEEQQIRTGFIVSGRPYQPQMRLLRRPLDLMIATPGRLNDLVDNNKADFSNIELLIIDDLTAIHKKGLSELIDKIVEQKPAETPVVAFVRHDTDVTPYAQKLLPGADEITIEDEKSLLLQLPQVTHLADDFTHKLALTDHLLDNLNHKPTVIFTNTSKTAKALADSLANHGHTADATHLLDEEERNLEACPILIVPDQENFVPDMDGHTPVIHFEIPDKIETYQQRLQHVLGTDGRTENVALLASGSDRDNLKKIEEFQGEAIEKRNIPGLEPKQNSRGKGGQKPGRKPQKKAGGQNPRSRNKQGPSSGGSNAADKQRARKGPYGRLNGGNQRKTTGNKPRGSNEGGNYEIGSWEKQDYAPRQPNADKKVVIRYKEKKRRTLIK
ncbi:MAG: DEAD/DEAH box helicase [Thiolinea sp.]